jgi:hypothetical protein
VDPPEEGARRVVEIVEAVQDRTAAKLRAAAFRFDFNIEGSTSKRKEPAIRAGFFFVNLHGIFLIEKICKIFTGRAVQKSVHCTFAHGYNCSRLGGFNNTLTCRGFPVSVYSEMPIQVLRGLVQSLPTLVHPFPVY